MRFQEYESDNDDTDELDDVLNSDNKLTAAEIEGDEVPGALACANCRVYSTKELFTKMESDRIDVEPPYQRDVVWPKASQSALIDSIMKNKWVPTLLFSERQVGNSRNGKSAKTKWVCMDGKQRLTSIKLFFEGKIPWYRQPGVPWYFRQSDPPSPSRKIISEEIQEIFLGRAITTALYSNLSELQERDIFRLVQEGKPLTIGEKMQAAAGPWGEYFDGLTQKYMVRSKDHPNGWAGRIANLKRGADFKTMSNMVLLIRDKMKRHPEPPTYISSLSLQKAMGELIDEPVPNDLKREVKELLDSFMSVSLLAPPNTVYTIELNTPDAIFTPIVRGRKTMLSPVELIWIPYLISYHGKELSHARLLELIELFKLDIRKEYPREVKNNTVVTRFIIEWIHTVDVRSRLKGRYSGYQVPRLVEQDDEPLPNSRPVRTVQPVPKSHDSNTKSVIRKRSGDTSSLEPGPAEPERSQKKLRPSSSLTSSNVSGSKSQMSQTQPSVRRPSSTVAHPKTTTPSSSQAMPGQSNGPSATARGSVPPGSAYTTQAQKILNSERVRTSTPNSLSFLNPPGFQLARLGNFSNQLSPNLSRPSPFPGVASRIVPNYPNQNPTGRFQLPSKPIDPRTVVAQRPINPVLQPSKLNSNQFAGIDFNRANTDPRLCPRPQHLGQGNHHELSSDPRLRPGQPFPEQGSHGLFRRASPGLNSTLLGHPAW